MAIKMRVVDLDSVDENNAALALPGRVGRENRKLVAGIVLASLLHARARTHHVVKTLRHCVCALKNGIPILASPTVFDQVVRYHIHIHFAEFFASCHGGQHLEYGALSQTYHVRTTSPSPSNSSPTPDPILKFCITNHYAAALQEVLGKHDVIGLTAHAFGGFSEASLRRTLRGPSNTMRHALDLKGWFT